MEYLFRVNFEKKSFHRHRRDTYRHSFLATERNQIDEFFTQSSLTQKPVVKYRLDLVGRFSMEISLFP